MAHKENALPCIPWCDLVRQEAVAFPDVRVETMFVDNLSMQLVMNPLRFDVILWRWHGQGDLTPRDPYYSLDATLGASFLLGGAK